MTIGRFIITEERNFSVEAENGIQNTNISIPEFSGITSFVVALKMLPLEKDSIEKKLEFKENILEGFEKHSNMAETMLRSSLIMEMVSKGSDDVQLSLSSRWSKIKVTPIMLPNEKKPLAISVDIYFIQERTSYEDPTEEIFKILQDYIIENNYQTFVIQLVVNHKVKRFDRK